MLAGGEIKLQCQCQAVWKCKIGVASGAGGFKGAALMLQKGLWR